MASLERIDPSMNYGVKGNDVLICSALNKSHAGQRASTLTDEERLIQLRNGCFTQVYWDSVYGIDEPRREQRAKASVEYKESVIRFIN